MILPVARAAVTAIAASLAYNTGRNVYETIQITKSTLHPTPNSLTDGHTSVVHVAEDSPSSNRILLDPVAISSMPTSVVELQALSRRQIINLYNNHCIVPNDLSIIDGEWQGILLNNNGLVCMICT
jgi:hypothetical protein